MFTSKKSACKTLKKIINLFPLEFEKYDLAYNEKESILLEVLEVLGQKGYRHKKNWWLWIVRKDLAPQWFRDSVQLALKKDLNYRYLSDQDLKKQVDGYIQSVKKGYSVVTLAHSQGNFFTNQAFGWMEESTPYESMLKMVSVASPDSFVWKEGPHITLKSDFVHGVPGSLPWNVENTNPNHRGHSIREHYLSGKESLEKIEKSLNFEPRESLRILKSQYLHESFKDFSRWVRSFYHLGAARPKLQPHQCLAINMFVYQSNWFGFSCEERSLANLQKHFEEQKPYLTDANIVRWESPLYGIPFNLIPSTYSYPDYSQLFAKNEECLLTPEKQRSMYKDSTFQQAMDFIKKPDFDVL